MAPQGAPKGAPLQKQKPQSRELRARTAESRKLTAESRKLIAESSKRSKKRRPPWASASRVRGCTLRLGHVHHVALLAGDNLVVGGNLEQRRARLAARDGRHLSGHRSHH